GMRGIVEVRDDQVDPQPRASPLRPELKPLRGAKITAFKTDELKTNFSLKYEVQGLTRKINYNLNPNGTWTFIFVNEKGMEQTQTYNRQDRPEKKGKPKKKD